MVFVVPVAGSAIGQPGAVILTGNWDGGTVDKTRPQLPMSGRPLFTVMHVIRRCRCVDVSTFTTHWANEPDVIDFPDLRSSGARNRDLRERHLLRSRAQRLVVVLREGCSCPPPGDSGSEARTE